MIKPIFIRFSECVINVVDIRSICHTGSKTRLAFVQRDGQFTFEGDVREELWGLIKLALAPKDEPQPELAAEPEPPVEAGATTNPIVGQLADGTPVYAA